MPPHEATPGRLAAVVDQLQSAVAPDQVRADAADVAPFGRDWTRRYGVSPIAVVSPRSTEQVSAALKVCNDNGVAIVAQGGRTGLVGGGVPNQPMSVVVETSQLSWLSEVSATGQVTAGAGVTIEQLQTHAAKVGWSYGIDLASRSAATVGGTIATNAGGIRVVRYGDTRAQVVGATAVTAQGDVVSRMQGWAKDSTGYDLARLLVGSEGTLALITEARLQLVPPLPRDRVTVMFGSATFAEAAQICRLIGRDQPLLAAEFITADAMDVVCRAIDAPPPLNHDVALAVLLEIESLDVAAETLSTLAEVVVDPTLWRYREQQSDAVRQQNPAHLLDIALPLDQLDTMFDAVRRLLEPQPIPAFGHLMEGNVHLPILGVADDAGVDAAVFRLVAELGGSISSEHGIGVAKADWLELTRTPAETALMKRIKSAWDPNGVMNPGVLFAANQE